MESTGANRVCAGVDVQEPRSQANRSTIITIVIDNQTPIADRKCLGPHHPEPTHYVD